MKTCKSCNTEKATVEFYSGKAHCKPCYKLKKKSWKIETKRSDKHKVKPEDRLAGKTLTRNCLRCNAEFSFVYARGRGQVFCSTYCQEHNYEKTCQNCNTVFKGRWANKFCTVECKYAAMIGKPRYATEYTLDCDTCGASFVSASPGAKYCPSCPSESNAARLALMVKVRAGMSRNDIKLRNEYKAILRNDPCSLCQFEGGTIDHIKPINSGGSDMWDNLSGACKRCNSSKNDQELLHFLLKHPIGSR